MLTRKTRLTGALVALGAALALSPSASLADTVISTQVTEEDTVSAYGGRLVWTQSVFVDSYDDVARHVRLMTLADGKPTRVPVPDARRTRHGRARLALQDVDVGPGPDGEPVAAYPRCLGGPDSGYSPRRCDIYMYDFASARETKVKAASKWRYGETSASIWKDKIAFVRCIEPSWRCAADVPDDSNPSIHVASLDGKAFRNVGRVSQFLWDGIDFDGRQVTYRDNKGIWLESLTGRRILVQPEGGAEPSLAEGSVYYAVGGSVIGALEAGVFARYEVATASTQPPHSAQAIQSTWGFGRSPGRGPALCTSGGRPRTARWWWGRRTPSTGSPSTVDTHGPDIGPG